MSTVEKLLAENAKLQAKIVRAQNEVEAELEAQAKREQETRRAWNEKLVAGYDAQVWERRLVELEAELEVAFAQELSQQPWAKAWSDLVKTGMVYRETAVAVGGAKQELGIVANDPIPSPVSATYFEYFQRILLRAAQRAAAEEIETLAAVGTGTSPLLTYRQALGHFEIDQASFNRLISAGDVTPVDVDGAHRFDRDQVEAALRETRR